VKVGYCRAVFEVARCKRKYGGTFTRPCDRNIEALVDLAGSPETSEALKVEVFQALFNLLGPTSVLLDDKIVVRLLEACLQCLAGVPVPCSHLSVAAQRSASLMAQNALGAVFNLLVHPLCILSALPGNVEVMFSLLSEDIYATCSFSVITILLTALAWGGLPEWMHDELETSALNFMERFDPLDSDCTGIAWDESDVAAFFLPLLRARPLICVHFASWCIAKYYFPDDALCARSCPQLRHTA